jgi:hypothetical protein
LRFKRKEVPGRGGELARRSKVSRAETQGRGGVRGKYYQQYRQGTNIVLLDSDVAAVFRDSESVNQALRVLIKAASQIEATTTPKPEQT